MSQSPCEQDLLHLFGHGGAVQVAKALAPALTEVLHRLVLQAHVSFVTHTNTDGMRRFVRTSLLVQDSHEYIFRLINATGFDFLIRIGNRADRSVC